MAHTIEQPNTTLAQAIRTQPMREVIERYPATIEILAEYGIDTCCGSGRCLAEAARLHALDEDAIVDQLLAVIEATEGRD
jgi:iron-sulfur cluster repair protein YtfE (RIC family)